MFYKKYLPDNLNSFTYNLEQINTFKMFSKKKNFKMLPNLYISGPDINNNLNIIKCFLKKSFNLKKIHLENINIPINFYNKNFNLIIQKNLFFYLIDINKLKKKDFYIFNNFIFNIIKTSNILQNSIKFSNNTIIPFKLFIIHNFHKASKIFKEYLIKSLDKFINNTRFIIISNSIENNKKLLSSTLTINIPKIKKNNLFNLLKNICEKEKFRISKKELNNIIKIENNILNNSILLLQLKIENKILYKNIYKKKYHLNLIFKYIQNKNINKIKEFIYKFLLVNFNINQFFFKNLKIFILNKENNNHKKIKYINIFAKFNNLYNNSNKNIIYLENLLYNILMLYHQKIL